MLRKELEQTREFEAVAMFEEGYNCAQSVFVTYADLFGLDRDLALKLSSPLGAGVGRMREICGVVSAMALLAGLQGGNADPQDDKGKAAIYEIVQKCSDMFKLEMGSIICRDLLGGVEREESPIPNSRTVDYYENRPCSKAVATASRIIEEIILI